jgi:stage V sporulation protein K
MNLENDNNGRKQPILDNNYNLWSLYSFSEIVRFKNSSDSNSDYINNSSNNHSLELSLNELDSLVGLENVKNTFLKMLTTLKKENLRGGKSLSTVQENLNSIFIAEPGSGTSTVASLFGKIFKELSLLQTGQLIEIDNTVLYGLSKIDSYLTLDKLFYESEGKIILVNNSILTLQAKNNFSESLLQYFLKKLYLNKDRVVAILCDTNEEMEELLTSIPVVQNQFPYIFNFEQYSNRQLLEIALRICEGRNFELDEGAMQRMMEIISRIRKDNRSNFFNARTVKEVLNKAIINQGKRILNTSNPKDSDLIKITSKDFAGI